MASWVSGLIDKKNATWCEQVALLVAVYVTAAGN